MIATERSKPTPKSTNSGIRSTRILSSANMGASLYEPINVYKPVAPNIGIVDGPFEYLTVGGVKMPLPFTTRMTVVRLSNGNLFLHSPIKFDGISLFTFSFSLMAINSVRETANIR